MQLTTAPSTLSMAPRPLGSAPMGVPGVGERITRIRTLRSCMACRTRKVKCDRAKPCTACQRNQLQCVYPEQTPRPPRPRRPDAELLERIARLEHVIESMPAEQRHDGPGGGGPGGGERKQLSEERSPSATERTMSDVSADSTMGGDDRQNGFGHLLKTGDGKTRYVGQSSWAALSDEVAAVRELLDDQAEPADEGQFSSIFFHSANRDLTELHPPPQMGYYLYQAYKLAVDPVLHVLHKGTFERDYTAFQQAKESGTADTTDGFEALVFAVYYAAVISMQPDAVFTRYGVEKHMLANHYRFALEHALSNANFLHCEHFYTLQALTIFVFFLRQQGDTRTSWSLIGLVIRNAQGLGLHRDSSHFDLKPLEAEMRRRLWYELCLLDLRIAEDHGAESSISSLSYDTRKPLNLNDEDLTEHHTEMPPPRTGFSEMSFMLLRLQFIDCFRSLADPRAVAWSTMSLQEKHNMIEDLCSNVQEKYLTNLQLNEPIQFCFSMASRLVTSKARLFLYQQYRNSWNGQTLPENMKIELFNSAVDTLEATIELVTHAASQPWHWYFRGFHQAHAIAIILLELSTNPVDVLWDRAWHTLEAFMGNKDCYSTGSPEHSQKIWAPLNKLKDRALKKRMQYQQAGGLPLASSAPSSDTSSASSSANGANPFNPHQQQQQQQQHQHQQQQQQTAATAAATAESNYVFEQLSNSPIDWVYPPATLDG